MKLPARDRLPYHVIELVYAFALLLWFFLPLIFRRAGTLSPPLLPFAVAKGLGQHPVLFIALALGSWSIPLLALWKVAAFFLGGRFPVWTDPTRAGSVLVGLAASSLVLICHVAHAASFATSYGYFLVSSPIMWAMGVVSLGYNAYSLVALIRSSSARDESYLEYQEFQRRLPSTARGFKALLGSGGIQRRLVLSFSGIVLLIIVVICAVLLSDFGRTIMEAVIANGEGLADRAASVVKTSLGDSIAIDDYLTLEAKKNAVAAFPFDSLSFYRRDPKTGGMVVAASTSPALRGKKLPPSDLKLTDTMYRDSDSGKRIEFLSPVTLSSIFLGYVSVDYDKDVILAPYFRTQIKVIIIALISIYLSVFITYLFGRNIVFPILFLRMSVNAIARTLEDMIKGSQRISAELLRYKDRVLTRDEIKGLSLEIGNMTTVIRGVLPYVSASTLKHSERDVPSTEARELAFLFTDIRGFTTLCEGQEPAEVVNMLNHYLELQSSVIMANGGDIDKFVGDEIMAMFEGPSKELNACRAGIAIRAAMAKEKQLAEAANKNVVAIGIGINTGPVVFGSVGARDRMDFTSIGDTVNLAARLEGANKTYGTKSLITEAVHEKVKDELLCREIDLLTVKGKSQPVRIYEILQERRSAAPRLVEFAELFQKGLDQYRKQNWKTAERVFTKLATDLKDETSTVFLGRIKLFATNPPGPSWDGVFNLTVK